MPAKVYRGDTWVRRWRMTDTAGAPIDLTGVTARLQARDTAMGLVAVAASTADGRLTVDAPAGVIDMRILRSRHHAAIHRCDIANRDAVRLKRRIRPFRHADARRPDCRLHAGHGDRRRWQLRQRLVAGAAAAGLSAQNGSRRRPKNPQRPVTISGGRTWPVISMSR